MHALFALLLGGSQSLVEQPGSFSSCMVPACLTELVGLGRRQVRANVVWSTGAVTLVTFAFVPVFPGVWGVLMPGRLEHSPAGDGGTSGPAVWISCAEICLGLKRAVSVVMLTILAPVQHFSSLVASLLSMFPWPVSTWLLGWLRGVLETH